MRSRVIQSTTNEIRMLDTKELRDYTGLGKNNAIRFGESIGAKRKIGRRVLWDKKIIDLYFDSLAQVDGKVEM